MVIADAVDTRISEPDPPNSDCMRCRNDGAGVAAGVDGASEEEEEEEEEAMCVGLRPEAPPPSAPFPAPDKARVAEFIERPDPDRSRGTSSPAPPPPRPPLPRAEIDRLPSCCSSSAIDRACAMTWVRARALLICLSSCRSPSFSYSLSAAWIRACTSCCSISVISTRCWAARV